MTSTMPIHECWIHEPKAAAYLQAAMEWTVNNKPQETDLNTLCDDVNHAKPPAKPAL
jgi:hypothetical protein